MVRVQIICGHTKAVYNSIIPRQDVRIIFIYIFIYFLLAPLRHTAADRISTFIFMRFFFFFSVTRVERATVIRMVVFKTVAGREGTVSEHNTNIRFE